MMKRNTIVLATIMVLMLLVACGKNTQSQTPQAVIPKQDTVTEQTDDNNKQQTDEQNTTQEAANEPSGSRILIAYFTVPETDGVDTVSGASRVATEDGVVGNTEFVAKEIQKNLGGDLFRIETVQEYPGTHEPLLDYAYNEKSENARPQLSTHIDNLDDYDYIFVGYPNWNADLPMPLYSFFDEYDFSGKTIIPFVTHGGSGLSNTISTIEELEPDATVVEAALSVSRNNVANAENDIKNWTDSLVQD